MPSTEVLIKSDLSPLNIPDWKIKGRFLGKGRKANWKYLLVEAPLSVLSLGAYSCVTCTHLFILSGQSAGFIKAGP